MTPYLSKEDMRVPVVGRHPVTGIMIPYRTSLTPIEVRDIYEAHRKELLDLLVEAQGTLNERRAPHNIGWCAVKGECICGAKAINDPIDDLLARIEHHTNPT